MSVNSRTQRSPTPLLCLDATGYSITSSARSSSDSIALLRPTRRRATVGATQRADATRCSIRPFVEELMPGPIAVRR
jgi:hypothetical protein